MVGHRLLCAIGVAATCFIAVRPVAADPVTWRFTMLLESYAEEGRDTEQFFGTRLTRGQRLSGSLAFDPHALRFEESHPSQSITFDVGSRPRFSAVFFLFGQHVSGRASGLNILGSHHNDDLGASLELHMLLIDETSSVFADGVGHHPPPLEAFNLNGLTVDPPNSGCEFECIFPPNISFSGPIIELSRADPAPVPEPATLSLLATGTLGLAGRAWRRRRRNAPLK
jgi:hypothetical protein